MQIRTTQAGRHTQRVEVWITLILVFIIYYLREFLALTYLSHKYRACDKLEITLYTAHRKACLDSFVNTCLKSFSHSLNIVM